MDNSIQAQKTNTLATVTILLIFLMAVINQIFIMSLIVVFFKKIKMLIRSTARKYYVFVIFYVVSKMVLCIILEFKIIQGIPQDFENLDSQNIQTTFKNTMAFADCSVIELFMISFQYYLALSFSILGNTRVQKLVRILMQCVQMITFLTLMIPLLIFNLGLFSYDILNAFMCSLNCMTVAAFLVAFFFMNFKMTGVMLDKQTSEIVKKVYKLLLVILLSRMIMASIQILVQINISNGNFEDFITIIEKNQGQFVTLGFCFILYLLIVLLTEGLPLMMSLRESLLLAFQSSKSIRKQSLISSEDITEDAIRQDLLSNMQNNEDDSDENINKSTQQKNIFDIDELENVEKISQSSYFKILKGHFNGSWYFVREVGNISSYIIEQMSKQIDQLNKSEIKCINKLKVLQKNQKIFLLEKFLNYSLDEKMMKVHATVQKLELCIKIAKAIKKIHDKNYAHGAINPTNIMFDEHHHVILTGYGLQSLRKYLSLTSEYTNISLYTAIELLGSKRQKTISKPTIKSDIYSFGIIFYEIFSNNYKYRDLSIQDIRTKFLKENSRPKIPDELPESLKKVMRKCWQENPENRPDINWLINFMESIQESF